MKPATGGPDAEAAEFLERCHVALGQHTGGNPKPYLEQSPVQYAEKIETPVLILHSENDLRCNIEQGEHLFHALRVQQKDVEMVRFTGEGHELTRAGAPRHRVERFEILLDWFGRKL